MKWAAWLRANKHNLAPLTGQDRPALEALAAVWELLAYCDAAGRRGALLAALGLLQALQPKCWPLARELIAKSLDWGDRDRIWAELEQLAGEANNGRGLHFEHLIGELEAMAPAVPR